nr:hypothetical protein [Tanacetum cinerariifolium]
MSLKGERGQELLYKVGLSARVESYEDEGLGEEDASKQGRVADIDTNEDITLVSTDDEQMFDADQDLGGEEVKERQEKDKIGSKPNKNGKRDEARKSLKQLQLKEEEKPKKTKKEWPKTHTRIKSYASLKKRRKEKGHFCNLKKVQPQGLIVQTAQSCGARDEICNMTYNHEGL